MKPRLCGEGGAPDPDLEELMFQYARYLMISCSRPGSLPSNLQGLWNNSNNPPWRCDYHSDVNIQMNYWFVDQANLSDCFTPLSEWFFSIRDVRKEQTMAHFKKRGFAMHAENGIFGGSTYKWSSWRRVLDCEQPLGSLRLHARQGLPGETCLSDHEGSLHVLGRSP